MIPEASAILCGKPAMLPVPEQMLERGDYYGRIEKPPFCVSDKYTE